MAEDAKTNAAAAKAAAAEPTTEEKIRAWVAENLAHSALVKNPEAWNAVQEAIPALVAALK